MPEALRNQLGIAISKRAYKAYRELLASPRWQRAFNAGARPQRLLWASTGTKDPKASDMLYIEALASPFTVNTMPEATLKAFADHGEVGAILPADGGDCEEVLAQFAQAGIDVDALAAQLQDEGAKSFVQSWNELMAVIAAKSADAQDGQRSLNDERKEYGMATITGAAVPNPLPNGRPGRLSRPTMRRFADCTCAPFSRTTPGAATG